MTDLQLGIVGGSIRAAVQSARRAGIKVWGADLFADRDTFAAQDAVAAQDAWNGIRIEDFSQLPSRFARYGSVPWMYTGGLENHPQLLEKLQQVAPLWGISGRSLQSIRNPDALYRVLKQSQIAMAEVRRSPPDDPGWLTKPLRSAGGRGIRRWVPGEFFERNLRYFQRFVRGRPQAGLFIGDGARASLLGITESWTTGESGSEHPFTYAGSIGPSSASAEDAADWEKIGNCLARHCELCGLFGVDAIRGDHGLQVLEVNPRYTASMELVERVTGVSLVALHREAFLGRWSPTTLPPDNRRCGGKVVVYAARSLRISDSRSDRWLESAAETPWPRIADIPWGGSEVAAGAPICTRFNFGSSADEVRVRLDEDVRETLDELQSDQHS